MCKEGSPKYWKTGILQIFQIPLVHIPEYNLRIIYNMDVSTVSVKWNENIA
jgi:hypothetical protein